MLRIRAVDRGSEARARAAPVGEAEIVRDFADPRLELVRLLQAAAEIEHALLVQYLYAAFSVKPAYPKVSGSLAGRATDLLGVAIQEMRHLHVVNQLLVTVGAAPSLVAHDFPFEPALYPFPLHLEPLSRLSLAKYAYTEAPADAVARDGDDAEFLDQLYAVLGDVRPNHVGSLYDAVIAIVRELGDPELDPWVERLRMVKDEGEGDHFQLFKQLFLGTHPGFGGVAVWDLPPDDPGYPALPVPVDPSAYEGHPHQIADERAREVAWLGDLQYWISLMLLDLHYRNPEQSGFLFRAVDHMVGPLLALGRHLPARGAGIPFDPLGMGYSPGVDRAGSVDLLRRMVAEARRRTAALAPSLPEDYPRDADETTLAELDQLT